MRTATTAMAALAMLAITATISAKAEDEATVTYKSLSVDTALELAQAGLKSCRDGGFQIAISVVDRAGNLQVTLRDRLAGPHTPDTAYRKAWTAVSFRTNTTALSKVTEKGGAWAIRNVTKALPLGGGVVIRDGDGVLLGAVGVSGAPAGSLDDGCAKAGIKAIEDKIAF